MESVTVAFSADSTSLSVLAAGISVVPDSGLPSGSAPILHLSSSWKKGKTS